MTLWHVHMICTSIPLHDPNTDSLLRRAPTHPETRTIAVCRTRNPPPARTSEALWGGNAPFPVASATLTSLSDKIACTSQYFTLHGLCGGACGKSYGRPTWHPAMYRTYDLATAHAGARGSFGGMPWGHADTRKIPARNLRESAVSHGSSCGHSRGRPRGHPTCLRVRVRKVIMRVKALRVYLITWI